MKVLSFWLFCHEMYLRKASFAPGIYSGIEKKDQNFVQIFNIVFKGIITHLSETSLFDSGRTTGCPKK